MIKEESDELVNICMREVKRQIERYRDYSKRNTKEMKGMLIYKCDICKKEVSDIETLVLYREKIDYCKNCEAKADKICKAIRNSIDYYADIFDKDLKKAEKVILSRRYE